jgi:hypothetical protein
MGTETKREKLECLTCRGYANGEVFICTEHMKAINAYERDREIKKELIEALKYEVMFSNDAEHRQKVLALIAKAEAE